MKRRAFITLLGGAAAWPLVARAQQRTIPAIGFLTGRAVDEAANVLAAFHAGLNETGYVEPRNVTIEYRWAHNQDDQLPALVNDLVRRQVAVIVAIGTAAPLTAKRATSTIPIVFTTSVDPVAIGLVSSLGRPGGNVTGVSRLTTEIVSKRLEILRELVPTATTIAWLGNPTSPSSSSERPLLRAAAYAVGQRIVTLEAQNESELEPAFATLADHGAGALLVSADVFFVSRRDHIVALAARYGVPAMYVVRDYVAAGGLVSYGSSLADAYRLVGTYAGRILAGARPADLPVQQPTKFELAINLRAAKALGLPVPSTLLVRADEVIE